jgi:uncharacterized damage-inducible protein DinB
MHPRITELLDYAQRQRVGLFAAVSLIPEPLRDRRGDVDAWSVAEVLEHLYRVESGIARLLARSAERAKAAGLEQEDDTRSVLGSLDELRLTERGERMRAPELVMPRGELTAAQGIAALEESRRALVTALEAADGLALGRITHAHPLMGPLNLYQWVLFVGQHEARHVGQVRDLARQLTGAQLRE